MEKTLERFSSLAKVAVKRLRTCEQGSHNFATYPSYIDEGVPHKVTSISVKGDTLVFGLGMEDPSGWLNVNIPLALYTERTEEILRDSECREDALMTLRSEVRILLTFLKEWFEGRLDALNEESARQKSQCDPYWEVFANGVEVDFEKRAVSFEYTVMNDKFWDDVPFDTLKAENGLDMDEYARICKELQEDEARSSSSTVIILWPSVQTLMDCEGFRENSALCSSDELYRKYGDSAYAVDKDWLETLPAETLDRVFSLQETYAGPVVDFGSLEKTDGLMTI